MLLINYLPPEQMPSHQRDFPRESRRVEIAGPEGSRLLGLWVVCYLLAIFAAIGVVGSFANGATPTASVGAMVER